MHKMVFILISLFLVLIVLGCPPIDEDSISNTFQGTVTLLDGNDSLLSAIKVSHNSFTYTYEIYCDSTGSFEIFTGDRNVYNTVTLLFSCEGYRDQYYPARNTNNQIGEIILVPLEE